MPAPSQVPLAGSAHPLHLAELAADAGILFHGIGGFALQFEDALAAVFPFYGEDFVDRCIQVVDARLYHFGGGCVHIVPIVPHHIGACVQGACGAPGQPSRIVAVPPQGQAFFGFGQVFVNLFVYLFRRGLGHVGIGGFHYLDGDQRHFAKGAYQVEVAPGTEEERFAAVADGFGVVLVSALLNVVQDFVALVDDFVVLSPIGTQRAVGGSVFEVVPHGGLVAAVAGVTAFLGVLAAHHVHHKSRNTGSDIVRAHQVVDVEYLSAYKGVRRVIFRELPQRVAVQEVVAGCQ